MVIQSDDYIILDGVSSNTIGLYCDTPAVPPMSRQRYTVYQTGAEQDGTTPDSSFENIEYPVNLYTFKRESFDNADVYQYLFNKRKLQFSRHSGYEYRIQQIEVSPPSFIADGARIQYTVTFTLSPFRYLTANNAVTVESGDIVENVGTYFSRPVITVTGSGTIAITVNGRTFTITDVSGTVVIDSEKHICYSGDTIIYNKDSGNYPLLAVGNNIISYTGTVTAFSLIKNERCF